MSAASYSKFTFACLAIERGLAYGTPRFGAEQVVIGGSTALVCADSNYRRLTRTAYTNESNVAHYPALTSR